MRSFAFTLAAAAAVFTAPAASAAVLFADNFNSAPPYPTVTTLNFTAFPSFTVTTGTVDYVRDNTVFLRCAGNTGACIDLAGTSFAASSEITSTSFNLVPGVQYVLSFALSGSQRVFGGTSNSAQVLFSNASVNFAPVTITKGRDDPWQTYSYIFSVTGPLSTSVVFRGLSTASNAGLLLDDVRVADVPLPAAAPLLLAGLAGLGFASRRRRTA